MKWTIREEEYLLNNYSENNKDELVKYLERSWSAIKSKYKYLTKEIVIDFDNTNLYKKEGEMILKKCSRCDEFYPMNTDYYFTGKKFKDGYENKCKVCLGKNFTQKICAEGYRICKKCKRELPLTRIYYPKFQGEKDFRWVCRECGADGHFMDENYKYRRNWTEEENEQFKSLYPHYTNERLIELYYPSETNKTLIDRAYVLKLRKTDEAKEEAHNQQAIKVSIKLKGRVFSEEHRENISKTRKRLHKEGILSSPWLGRIVTEEERERMRLRVKGRWSGTNNPQYGIDRKGENNTNWKGGITPLYQYLRKSINNWKEQSMNYCEHRCVLSGTWFDEIHHLVPFRDIVNEVFCELGIEEKKEVSDYSEEVLARIEKAIKEKHMLYGLGVCLNKDIHKLFHDLYGYTGMNEEMFEEFKYRYKNGEFDEQLDKRLSSVKAKKRLLENNRSINI